VLAAQPPALRTPSDGASHDGLCRQGAPGWVPRQALRAGTLRKMNPPASERANAYSAETDFKLFGFATKKHLSHISAPRT